MLRLDAAGEECSIDELLVRFAGRPWLYELADLPDHERLAAATAGAVRLYRRGLTTREPIETGEGRHVVVVDGDLHTTDHAEFRTNDYVPARVIVTGDLHARSLSFANGARVVVEGSAHVQRACVGQHGDRDAVLSVHGELSVPVLLLDWYTTAYAERGLRALVYSSGAFWEDLQPDIVDDREGRDGRFFPPGLLDRFGDLDLDKAIAASRTEAPLLLPGVEESFPGRLVPRPTR